MALEVFLSYSHQDHTFRSELDTHLSNLKRQGTISSFENVVQGIRRAIADLAKHGAIAHP